MSKASEGLSPTPSLQTTGIVAGAFFDNVPLYSRAWDTHLSRGRGLVDGVPLLQIRCYT